MENKRVCPVEKASGLDSKLRRWLQNPRKILAPYIFPGMKVLDLGCGTGFLSIEIASMLNGTGALVAADVQQGMLAKLQNKIQNTELEHTIRLHKCATSSIGLSEKFDLIVVFYVAHEIPNHRQLFSELHGLLEDSGHILLVEPKIHVSKKSFSDMVNRVLAGGFMVVDEPKLFFSRSLLLQKKM